MVQFCFFSSQPFTTKLIQSNMKMFRYEIIWEKTLPSGFLNAKKMPLKIHENILVFYKHLPTYNPIMQK
nr:MAG TPA: adenine-specific methyltransferase [Caudoviricetes sp.]